MYKIKYYNIQKLSEYYQTKTLIGTNLDVLC